MKSCIVDKDMISCREGWRERIRADFTCDPSA